jgi:pimeloyl-ACP methyl ester carboxylesterase
MTDGYITTDDGVRLYFECIGAGGRRRVVAHGAPVRAQRQPRAPPRRVVAFDARNRGRSDRVTDEARLARELDFEVEDIDAVRRHFGADDIDLLGHSYVGLLAILYAMRFPAHVRRVIQIGPAGPDGGATYPIERADDIAVRQTVLGRLAAFAAEPPSDPEERCHRGWDVLRPLYVVDPADVSKLDGFARCSLECERHALEFVVAHIMPALSALTLRAEDLAAVRCPVLTIHGRRDRSAPYAAGCEWARLLPDARLVGVENAGHMPWIESPAEVLGAIETFLAGEWPAQALQAQGPRPKA